MNTLLWTLLGSALCIIYTEGAEDENGINFNDTEVLVDAMKKGFPCCATCEEKGGVCSTSKPKDGYQIIDKCVGYKDGAKTYCGYCWKYPVDVPCEDPCKKKGGMCSFTQPKPGYQIIDKCVGTSGGAEVDCGYCWLYQEEPCDVPCKMKGGMCSDTQPKPGYQIIDKCVGISGGAATYCGSCWKYTVTPCTSRVCDLKGGKCSPTSPGKGWQVSGTCGTKDCFCWTSKIIIDDPFDLEPLELAP